MSKYKNISNELIKFLLKSNAIPNFREYTNLNSKNSFGNIMIEDLGDSLPFIFWAGKKINLKYCKIADDSAKHLIKIFQEINGFFYTSDKLKFLKPYNFDKMTDLLLGINLMYALTKDKYYLEASKKFFNNFDKFVYKNKGLIPLINFNRIGFNLNFSSGKFGLYIEELVNLYNFTGDKKYLNLAKYISNPWINSTYFEKNKLFPFLFKPNFLKPLANLFFKKIIGFNIDSAMGSKANTNLIYGLNVLYSVTGDKILLEVLEDWCQGVVSNFMSKDGSLFTLWDENGKNKFLGCDHAVIDCFLEIYSSTKNRKILNHAETMADFWLTRQDISGLIHQGVEGYEVCIDKKLKFGNKPNYFRLDPQVDFFVVLIKLYQLTNKKIYLTKAIKLVSGIYKYHSFNSGFAEILDESKNKVSYIIETKFLFLILKALMFEEYVLNNRIYKNKIIRLLLRDR